MWTRRQLLPALAIFVTAGAAQILRPREVPRDKQLQLDAIVPSQFGNWTEQATARIIQPSTSDDLEHDVYSQELTRSYINPDQSVIMLLIAYGPSQSGYLQVHQPEICYAAQGFRVRSLSGYSLPLAGGHSLPLTRLSTFREGRPEPLTYWIRVGDDIPQTQIQRLLTKFRMGLVREIPDGLLVRVSSISTNLDSAFAIQDEFIRDLLHAIAPENRQFVIGGLAPDIGT
jgi:EpsI family protein